MNAFLLVPLVSCLVCLACGALVLSREPEDTSHRCAAALLFGAGFWGACEVLWTLTPDPDAALALVRVSALGWGFVGPLSFHLFLSQVRPRPRLLAAAPWLYLAAAVGVAAEWTTDSMHHAVSAVPWGWAYEVGPGYRAWLAFTCATAGLGIGVAFLALRRSDIPAQRAQRPWLRVGVGSPLLVGSLSDGLLPILGVQLPRLGVASFAALGVAITWSVLRFGHSLMATGSLAGNVLAGLQDGVALVTPSGRIHFVNRRFAELVGRKPDALLAARLPDVVPEVEVREGDALAEVELARPGAASVPVALSTRPLHDKRGHLLGSLVVLRDLRDVAELRRKLVVSGRLAAVGELAAGIAHEINNPLSFVGANLRLLGEHWAALAKARDEQRPVALEGLLAESEELILESIEGVERAAAIVRDVRVLAHGGVRPRQAVDVNLVVEHAVRMARPRLGHRTRLERILQPVPEIHASPGELEQVLLNLLINAKSAIGESGTIQVESLRDGDHVEVRVRDDGCGIDAETLERVFDPFFTTKPVGEGTGLGLAISHEIVRRHRGELRIESTPGAGTTVCVRLPIDPRAS